MGRPRQQHCSKCGLKYTRYYAAKGRNAPRGYCKPCVSAYFHTRHWYVLQVHLDKRDVPLIRELAKADGYSSLAAFARAAIRRYDLRLLSIR